MVDRCYEGLKVLDFGRVVAAPHCARWFADLGADVIKVERPPEGDDTRGDPYRYPSGQSTAFMQQNWGKRSIALDLQKAPAIDIVRGLASWADVLIENFRPGVMEKLGISYPILKEVNPRLIFCSISQYGQTGPHATRRGYGPLAEAESGMSELTGELNGPPMPTQVAVADNMAAGMAFGAIGAALYYRAKSDRGQHVDISLLDAAFQMHEVAIQQVVATDGKLKMQRRGLYEETWVPGGYFEGRDGWICIMIGNESMWGPLVRAMGMPGLADDPKYADFAARAANRDDVYRLLRHWVAGLESVDDGVNVLVEAGIPVGRVNDLVQAVHHPQLQARDMLPARDHPTLGALRVMNSGLNFSTTAGDVHGEPPELGEHSWEILQSLGYTEEDYKRLVGAAVVLGPAP